MQRMDINRYTDDRLFTHWPDFGVNMVHVVCDACSTKE